MKQLCDSIHVITKSDSAMIKFAKWISKTKINTTTSHRSLKKQIWDSNDTNKMQTTKWIWNLDNKLNYHHNELNAIIFNK